MTVSGGGAPDPDEPGRREPASFPQIDGGPAGDTTPRSSTDRLFGRADDDGRPAPPLIAERVGGGHRDSRRRWAVAALATVLVLGTIAGVFVLSGPRPGTPSLVTHFAPADSVVYVEARLDLPDGQREQVAQFMSHFPGFADPATFDQKLDDTLAEILRAAPAGMEWLGRVRPSLTGQLAAFSTDVGASDQDRPPYTLVLEVADRGEVETELSLGLAGTGATSIAHGDALVHLLTPAGEAGAALGLSDHALVLAGTADEVRAALDVRAGASASLADDEFFLGQLGALHADRLATFYFDGDRYGAALADRLTGEVLGAPVPGGMDWLSGLSSAKVVGQLRAEGDRLAMTTRAQRTDDSGLPPFPGNRATTLAEAMPADSIVYGEFRDVGQAVTFLLERAFAQVEEAAGMPAQLDMVEQLLGTEPARFFDFVGDVAVSASYADGAFGGGLVATVDDQAVAAQRVERLLGAVRAAAAFGGGLRIEEQEHEGATVNVIELRSMPGEPPSMTMALAVAEGRLWLGLGDFVMESLDRDPAASLAASDRYRSAVAAVGAANAGVGFVDLAAARVLVEQHMPADVHSRYDAEQRPFIEPFDRLVAVSATDGNVSVGHVFLFVE